jgi:hypothetical protein
LHAQIRAGIKSPNSISNFSRPKWVKLGTLLKTPETKLDTKSLVTARGHKEKSHTKITGSPPAKRFLYSHIARLLTCCLSKMKLMRELE